MDNLKRRINENDAFLMQLRQTCIACVSFVRYLNNYEIYLQINFLHKL